MMVSTSSQIRITKRKVFRRPQTEEELDKLHNGLRNWHKRNKEWKYGDPEAIQESVMRGCDSSMNKYWDNKHIIQWYGLPVKVKIVRIRRR